MKTESSSPVSTIIPAAMIPFLAPIAAFAAEGTGRVRMLLMVSSLILNSVLIFRHLVLMMADLFGPPFCLLSSSSLST